MMHFQFCIEGKVRLNAELHARPCANRNFIIASRMAHLFLGIVLFAFVALISSRVSHSLVKHLKNMHGRYVDMLIHHRHMEKHEK